MDSSPPDSRSAWKVTERFMRVERAVLSSVTACALCAASLWLDVPHASAQAGKPDVLYYKSWAVVVAIEDYAFAPKREGAVADAKAVAVAMRDLGFEEVIEIYDEDATARQFRYILEDFLPRKVGRQDRVVIFFSGHAGSTSDMDGDTVGYLVPSDAQLDNVGKSLTLHQLKRLSHRIMSKHILLFLDTDVSGWHVTPAQQLSLEGRISPEPDTEKRAVQLLTAAKAGEPMLRKDGQGLFVHTLLAGLQGASDADENGWILASELGGYVSNTVGTASGGAQHPQFVRLDGDGDMILREGRNLTAKEPETPAERRAAAEALYYKSLEVLMDQKPPQDALVLLNQALAYDDEYGDAYVLKAYVLLDLVPNLEGALFAASQGVAYAPKNPDSHFTFGLVLQRQQRYAEAERAYLYALEVNSSYTDVYLVLGDLYAQHLNDPQKSVEAYERYLQLGGTASHPREYIDQAQRSQP